MTKPISQSTFYVPLDTSSLNAPKPTPATRNNIPSKLRGILNAPKKFITDNFSSGTKKHIKFQTSLPSAPTPMKLHPREPGLTGPKTQPLQAQPAVSKYMSDEALKLTLKNPGDFQLDKTGSTSYLIHHSSDGSIVRTPVQTDKNGQLSVPLKELQFANTLPMDTLEGLTRLLQQSKIMNLVE